MDNDSVIVLLTWRWHAATMEHCCNRTLTEQLPSLLPNQQH